MSAMPSVDAPLVSVALCTYNGATYLCEQLDSLLGQRDVRIEVVAVDDGSRDDTRAIRAPISNRYDRARARAEIRWITPRPRDARAAAPADRTRLA